MVQVEMVNKMLFSHRKRNRFVYELKSVYPTACLLLKVRHVGNWSKHYGFHFHSKAEKLVTRDVNILQTMRLISLVDQQKNTNPQP